MNLEFIKKSSGNDRINFSYVLGREVILDYVKTLDKYYQDFAVCVTEYGMLEQIFNRNFVENVLCNIEEHPKLIAIIENRIDTSEETLKNVLRFVILNSDTKHKINAMFKSVGLELQSIQKFNCADRYIDANKNTVLELIKNPKYNWFTPDEIWSL